MSESYKEAEKQFAKRIDEALGEAIDKWITEHTFVIKIGIHRIPVILHDDWDKSCFMIVGDATQVVKPEQNTKGKPNGES